ncbi:SDR family NAD(P)-dependent oxidoreductase [Staphylococcus xylosus]
MKSQHSGRIVTISSAYGDTVAPYKSVYVASKFAYIGSTKFVTLVILD